MALSQSSPSPQPIAAAVVVAGHAPYAMYVAAELSAVSARLRGPLLLEIGESFQVRMTRAEVVVEVATRVVEVVRGAYFELARYLHPDRLAAAGIVDGRREAQRVFARINEAFGVLSDPDRRAEQMQVVRAGGARVVAAQAEAAAAKVREVIGGEDAYRKGEMALRRMEFDTAIAQFRAAVELGPQEADHHAMLGWALYVAAPDKAQALPTARGHLRKAMELTSKSALPYLYLGRIARMEGDATAAVNHLRQALELAPRPLLRACS